MTHREIRINSKNIMRLAAMVSMFSQCFDDVIIVVICGTHSAGLIGAMKYCISPSAHAVLTFFLYLDQ